MLDLTGLPALDLAIGLAFIFFLLATLAATIQEFIAAIWGLRARTLEQGLRSMLEDPEKGWKYVDAFYDHELIRSLYRTDPPDAVLKARNQTVKAKPQAAELGRNARKTPSALKRTSGPSYLSPRAFALVAVKTLMPAADEKTGFDAADDLIRHLPGALQARLRPMVEQAQGDVAKLRTNLEAWFDDTMARVSGWYKRKTQIILLVIGVAVVVALNANTLAMGERIWKDDTVRAAVVAQASPTQGGGPASVRRLNTAADNVDQVAKVGIPMGWRGAAVPRGVGAIALAVLGWLLTILAISLGAPFWFDTLSRLSRLRSSGKPETPLPASGSGKANERILTPPQVPTVVLQLAPGEPSGEKNGQKTITRPPSAKKTTARQSRDKPG
jgi:hypothetical protein